MFGVRILSLKNKYVASEVRKSNDLVEQNSIAMRNKRCELKYYSNYHRLVALFAPQSDRKKILFHQTHFT